MALPSAACVVLDDFLSHVEQLLSNISYKLGFNYTGKYRTATAHKNIDTNEILA